MRWVTEKMGGVVLIVGYLLMGGVLFTGPSDGILMATATGQGLFFFIILPACSLLIGIAAVLQWPYATVGAVLSGSYLAVVGIALALFVPTIPAVNGLGVVLLGFGTFSIVAVLRSIAAQYVPDQPL